MRIGKEQISKEQYREMFMLLMPGQHYREHDSRSVRILGCSIILLVCLVVVPSLLAHHGLARFDTTHIVSMQGTITGFKWINPHAYVYADLKDERGKIANWSMECGSLAMLSRFGWSPTVLKPGDKVTVRGFIAKDGSAYMSLQKIEFKDGRWLPGAP